MTENQVKITYSDNNPNYLSPKLQGGNNIVLTDNGNFIRIDAITSPGDHSVLVDGNDTSPGYLGSKLEAGSGVSLVNTGSTIKINANVQSGDHKVIVDGNDTSPGYLLSKLTAGQNVTLTNNGSSIEISSIDTGMLNPMTTLGDIIVGGVDGAPDRLGIGTDGYVLTASSGSPTWAAIPTQTGDHKVLVDSSDTNPQYLGVKLKAGVGINISYYNHDKMEIAALGQVKVNLLGTMDYLENKILQGSGITLTKTNNDITIAANTQPGDHKVVIDGNDTSPGYLASKLTAGTNITITNNGTDLEISSIDTGMLNPMTALGDIIIGDANGDPARLGIGSEGYVLTVSSGSPAWVAIPTQTGDHKVLATNFDTSGAGYLDSKIGFNSPLIATGTDILTVSIDYGQNGQVLTTEGTTVKWTNLPRRIDWTVETAFINGTFNQTLDRTFYVEMFPECEFNLIDAMVAVLENSSSSDEWRVAVFDNTRTMTYYGTSTGTSTNFRKFTSLTKLVDHTFDANNVYYLAISQHTAGNANSKLKTAAVTSPAYCWYEDVALTSGRAMPATSSLVAVSGKVPAIGLRGR